VSGLRYLGLLAACLGLLTSPAARAQTDAEAAIHWAYAPYFGTGWYRAEGAEEILALSFRTGKILREAELGPNGERRIGLRLRFPVAVSVHNLDSNPPFGGFDLDNLSAISAVPGVEIEIPMNERWSLKSLSYAGWGTRLDGTDSAYIYWAGIRSSLSFGDGPLRWSMINGLTGVGYRPKGLPSDLVLPLLTGFEFSRPLANRKLGDDMLYLNWHVAHSHYFDEVELGLPDAEGAPLRIDSEWELGIAVGKGDKKIKVGPFGIDRIGLAYRFGAGGDFAGIGLIFSSLFDR